MEYIVNYVYVTIHAVEAFHVIFIHSANFASFNAIPVILPNLILSSFDTA